MTGSAESEPFASIIIPARDAEATLEEALECLRSQTQPDWECIIVDDGSVDRTLEISQAAADRDPRIHVLSQPNAGVGAARNAALAMARGTWVLLLDADDWLEPDALAVLGGAVRADSSLDAAYGQWAQATHDGGPLDQGEFWSEPESLFPVLTHHCVLVPHSCLFRRDLVDAVGSFDTTLTTCEDWDFWQRLARSGARFAAVPRLVARYRLRLDSASHDGAQVLADGMRVIDRGHAPDPRVRHPHPAYAAGQPRAEVAAHQVRLACWCAGREIGRGHDAAPLVDLLEGASPSAVDPFEAGTLLLDELLIVSGGAETAYATEGRLNPRIERFLHAVEGHLRSLGWSRRAQRAIEHRALQRTRRRPVQVGRGYGVSIELTLPVPDIEAPSGAEHLRCDLTLEGEPLGAIELPVCDGTVPSAVLIDAAAAATYWPVLGRFFERALYPQMLVRQAGGWALLRGQLVLAVGLGGDSQAAMRQAHDQAGWTVLLQELWRRPEWPNERFYRTGHGEESPPLAPLLNGWCLVEISMPPADVAAPEGEVQAVLDVGGVAVCRSVVPASKGSPIVTADQLRVALTLTAGVELARVTAREGIFGRPLDAAGSLAERLASAASRRMAGPIRPVDVPTTVHPTPRWGGIIGASRDDRRPALVLPARQVDGGCGTSASRRSALPAAAAATLVAAAQVADELAISVPSGTVAERVVYQPELMWRPVRPPEPRTPHGPLTAVRAAQQRFGRWLHDRTTVEITTDRLPILMYHQVAESGPNPLERSRVSPRALDEQLGHLRGQAFTGVTLDQWRAAASARRPLPGRNVCITFDGGDTDFLTDAWPVLRRHGFSATVFIVTDRVGKESRSDERFGAPAPPLDWDQIGQLESEGVRFGSHTATHVPLTGLPPAAVVEELGRSRAALHERLDHPLDAVAYPLGDADGITAHLAGGCGYTFGVTSRPSLSSLTDDLLMLPRLEVTRSLDLSGFTSMLEH